MADGTVEIEVELKTDKAKSQAQKDGREAGEAFGDSFSKETEKGTKKAKNAFDSLKDTIGRQKAELRDLKSEYSNVALEQGETSDAAQKLGEKIDALSADLSENEAAFKEASDAADKFDNTMGSASEEADNAGGHVSGLGDSIVGFAKRAAGALAALGIADKLKDVASAAVDAAAEVGAENAAFEQIMGDYAAEAQAKLEQVAEATGVADTRLTSAMTSMTAKFSGLGFGIEDATDLASRGLMLASDAAAFWDMSLQESQEHLNSFINGNYEGGEAIGLFANETQLAQYAIQEGIIGSKKEWSELDEATKQATRLEYAENMMALSGATGQASKEQSQFANVVGNTQENWRQLLAILGEPVMETVVVPAMLAASDAMAAAREEIESGMPHFQGFFDLLRTVAPILAGATAGFVAFKAAMAVGSAITAVQDALNGMTIAQYAAAAAQELLNFVVGMNPFVLFITILAAVVAALIVLWNTNDEFREALLSAWEAISEATSTVWDALVTLFTETLPNALITLTTSFMQLPANIGAALLAVIETILSFVASVISAAVSAGSGFLSNIMSFFGQLPSIILGLVSSALSALSSFVSGAISKAMSAGSGFLNGIRNGFSSAVSFVSSIPSRILGALGDLGSLLIDSGRSMLNGLAQGIKDGFSNALNAVKNGLEEIRSFFPFSPAKKGPFSGRGYTTFSGRAIMRDLGKGISAGTEMAEKSAREALERVQQSISAPVSAAASYEGAVSRAAVSTTTTNNSDNRQTINFNVPVQSPDQIAREMRMQRRYGLAGSY